MLYERIESVNQTASDTWLDCNDLVETDIDSSYRHFFSLSS